MRWAKVNDHWEFVFVNVPFRVNVSKEKYSVESSLYFTRLEGCLLDKKEYETVDDAKSDVELFVLNHLAQYSAIVHRECLEANVMTWRKLREQLDQIPEDELDEQVHHLDTDGYWIGEPRIKLAEQDQYMDEDDCRNVTDSSIIVEGAELVVEKGKYFLSTYNV